MSGYEILDLTVNFLLAIITLGGIITTIICTNKFTNKQIINQNKQSYRPYVRIEKLDLITNKPLNDCYVNEFDNYYKSIVLKNNLDLKYTESYITLVFKIINIGVGIANNIEIYDLRKEKKVHWNLNQSKNSEYIEENLSLCVMAVGETKEIRVAVKYIREKEFEVSDSCIFIIFYEDINKNLYSNEFHIQVSYDESENKFKLYYYIINSYDHGKEKYYQIKDKKSELNKFLILKGLNGNNKI